MSSEEIASADSLLQQLADLRAALTQANNATEAERRARRNAEADLGWWHATVANYVTSATVEDRRLLRETLAEALTYPHPGAALLAELDAARALGVWANDRRYWTCGICPACGFGKQLDGSEFHGSGCAIAAYNDAAVQAR